MRDSRLADDGCGVGALPSAAGLRVASVLFAVLVSTAWVAALPVIPDGMTPHEFYGGFFPTEGWLASLEPIPGERRSSPYQRLRVVDRKPEDAKAAWPGAVVLLTREEIGRMEAGLRRFMAVPTASYLGLVPRRNRISGNARVMLGKRDIPCPSADGGHLRWHPDEPDAIRCSRGHVVDPFELFPQTGVFRIAGPAGQEQEYPYHDNADGTKRVYLLGEFMDPLRTLTLARAAGQMAQLYALTSEAAYAIRGAAILTDFALAVPHWPKIARGVYSGLVGADRIRPLSDMRVYAGLWYDKYHSGIGGIPVDLAQAYDLLQSARVWEDLDRQVKGGDARALVESDLFLYTAVDEIRYDIRYPEPKSALSNYIPYQIAGLLAIGRAAGLPELVHYGYWKEQQLARKTLMADGMFPESPSYARQHVYGMARVTRLAEGYTDPPGFVSGIDGARLQDLDMLRDLPELNRAVGVLETLVYPDGSNMMVHDTYGSLLSRGFPAPEETRPRLYPAFGHAVLGRGTLRDGTAIQAHLHYSGNWGHAHLDMLNLILWAYRDELVSDIGYAHTYRMFANNTSSHNLVVVDRRYQERQLGSPGELVGWHAPVGYPQVTEVSAPEAYAQCSRYRRVLFLLPVGGGDNLVLDVFEVTGGSTHEWMGQGNCMVEGTLSVSVPTSPHAESYAADGKFFTPPAHSEYLRQRREKGLNAWWLEPGEDDPWYGVFRDVRKGRAESGLTARFGYQPEDYPELRLHLLSPAEADVYICTVPSLRRTWSKALRREEHEQVEQYRMPKLIVRRDGPAPLSSRFTALWEPMRDNELVASFRDLAPGASGPVALEIRTHAAVGGESIRVLYVPDPTVRLSLADGTELEGRYAVVARGGQGVRVALYDVTWLKTPDCTVAVDQCLPLPLERVARGLGGEYRVELTGSWPACEPAAGLGEGVPNMALLTQEGGRARAFPFDRVEAREDGRVGLLCSADPGFAYDARAGELRDTFSPFNVIGGRARVRLFSRVLLRSATGEPGVWRLRATNPVRVNGRLVEPTSTESEVRQ